MPTATLFDRKYVIENVSKLQLCATQDGLIEAFGVFVNRLPAYFWNTFAERLTRQVDPDLVPAVEGLLVNAAHECGYHTGYGIITSAEWKAIVAPMCETPEDVLHGAFAVLTALGWAKSEITELVPGQKMVVRAYDYYEADPVEYGRTGKYSAYMLRGVSSAFMDLAYGKTYPDGLRTFTCLQTKGLECGDDYGEFQITKV